jgi:acyl-CoA dehydrogenase
VTAGSHPPQVLRDAFEILDGRPLAEADASRLAAFGTFARENLEPVAYVVDQRSAPYLQAHDLQGGDVDRVELDPAHREVLGKLYASRLATGPLEGVHGWPFTFALMHEVADVGCLCSATVTLATVFSVAKYADPELRARVFPDLVANGGVRQGATWATEAQGGSDLGANRTVARPQGGNLWHLTGEKYFCSNVGAAYAVVSARPEGAPAGVRGVRLFLVPARRSDGSLNFRIRRLKEKMGTVAVPTGEVSLERSEAWALGTPEMGILPVMEMLNLSRIANSVGSAAVLHRAFEIAREHAASRSAFGRILREHPLLAQDLATIRVEAESATLLAFDAVFRFAQHWQEKPPYSPEFHALRLATHVAKMVTAEQAVRGSYLAMEIAGGPGYLEEYPLAKLVRDALVTPIWEGGANLQALDAREVRGRMHPEGSWVKDAQEAASHPDAPGLREFLETRMAALEPTGGEGDAKAQLRTWGELRQATLLAQRARHRPTPATRAARDLFVAVRTSRPARGLPGEFVEALLAA